METLHQLLWRHGQFLGQEWTWWSAVGWLGNLIFTTRFFVQWYYTEKRKQVVVPESFWWLSLTGSLMLLAYAIFSPHSLVFIVSYAFAWIPYMRNIVIHRRHALAQLACPSCSAVCPPRAKYCSACGTRLASAPLPG